MPTATQTETIYLCLYIDRTVAQGLHEFTEQQAVWKGRIVEAAIVE